MAQSKETDRAVQFDQAMREAESAPVSAKPPAGPGDGPLAGPARHREGGRSTTWSAAAPPRSRPSRAAARRSSPRASTRSPATVDRIEPSSSADGPGRPDDRGAAGLDRRFPARALGPRVRTSRPAGAGIQDRARDPLRSARSRSGRGWTGAASRPGSRTRSPRPSPIRPTAGASAARPSWPRRCRPSPRRSPTRPARRPSPTTLHDQPVWDAIGEWDRLTAGWRDGARGGRAPGGQRPRRAVPAIPGPASRLARLRARDGLPAGHGGHVAPLGRRRGCAGQAPEADDRPPG